MMIYTCLINWVVVLKSMEDHPTLVCVEMSSPGGNNEVMICLSAKLSRTSLILVRRCSVSKNAVLDCMTAVTLLISLNYSSKILQCNSSCLDSAELSRSLCIALSFHAIWIYALSSSTLADAKGQTDVMVMKFPPNDHSEP
jgi:hypothetical protein